MSWSPELVIGELRPWPESVKVVRGNSGEVMRYDRAERSGDGAVERGTCVMEYGGDVAEGTARVMGVYFCSECGSPNYNDCMPYYCIYCGKAVKR